MRFWPPACAARRTSRTRVLRALVCTAWLCIGIFCTGVTYAQDFQVHGFADLRLVGAADEASWTHGALGKTRYGDSDGLR